MATPAPAAPSPPPRPSAIALPASDPSCWANTRRVARSTEAPLVVLGGGFAEVDGGQRREDERLQGRDQAYLEEEDREPERQGHDAQALDAQQDHEAAGHEQDDQVPGEDVGEKTDGEADEAHEVREQLQDEHDRPQPARDPGGNQALDVAHEALRADALDVVREPGDEGQGERHRDVRGGGEQREGRDLYPEQVEL